MELVPIVIEVLKIVSILAVATLLFSYIAFRIRKKLAPQKSDEEVVDLKPNFINRSVKRLTQMTREIITEPAKKATLPRKEVVHKEFKKRAVEKATPPRPKEPSKEEIKTKRIEVVNSFSPPESKVETKKEMADADQKTNLRSLGDDVLDKYIDDEESKLYALKIKKEEEK